jgi:hypothetical protein
MAEADKLRNRGEETKGKLRRPLAAQRGTGI